MKTNFTHDALINEIQSLIPTGDFYGYAVLGEKLGGGDVLVSEGCRLYVIGDEYEALGAAWSFQDASLRHCVFHEVFSHYDYYAIDLDAAYNAVMEAKPGAKIDRVWDTWDWSKAPEYRVPSHDPLANMVSNIDAAISDVKDMTTMTQVFLDPSLQTVCIDEAEKLRRENAALRDQVRQLRHTYEAPMLRHTYEAPKVDITLDVSAGLSPACLTLLQESLTEMARSVLLLREGHDRAPIVTCKINVP